MVACFMLESIGIACEWRRQPHLREEPFVLASDACVKAACPLAKGMGVRIGMKLTTAKALCQGLAVLSYDACAYMEAAESVWDLIAVETNQIEPISPELCYADMDGIDLASRIRQLAKLIREKIGMPAGVGVGSSKLAARAAAEDGKVAMLNAEQESDLLATLPISSLTMLDAKTLSRLTKLGLNTLGDIRKVPRVELQRQFGRLAHRVNRLALGVDDDPVRPLWPKPSLECREGFEEESDSRERIEQAVQSCAESISRLLVAKGVYCRRLRLAAELADGGFFHETEELATPMRDASALIGGGLRLLSRMRIEASVSDIALSAHDLDGAGGIQLTLLDSNEEGHGYPHERQESLEAASKFLRRRIGPQAVAPAALMLRQKKLGLWTFPLTKRRNERVGVIVDSKGQPISYRRGGDVEYAIEKIINRWRESEWSWGKIADADCYRVASEDGGTCELRRIGGEWRLRAVED